MTDVIPQWVLDDMEPGEPLTLYTIDAVAQMMGVSRMGAYRWTLGETPKMRTVRVGSRMLRVPHTEVRRLLKGDPYMP